MSIVNTSIERINNPESFGNIWKKAKSDLIGKIKQIWGKWLLDEQ